MRLWVLLIPVLLFIGCGKKEQQTGKEAGAATQTGYAEVIDQNQGYIIENARVFVGEEPADAILDGVVKLVKAKSTVMVIRSSDEDNNVATILVLQFPAFAEGAAATYDGSEGPARFYVIGTGDNRGISTVSGVVSGELRFDKKESTELDLGLNRLVEAGTGSMEVVVSNIDSGGLSVPQEKKYAARYSLPIVTIDEIARITMPS
ncbi:MAG: hypothetical protein GXO82_05025 [Chlorobi bacterium]|nr:hypothetical protein [Chlorobiota bacterium]